MSPTPIYRQLKIGLFGIGLDTYWPQFPGLQSCLSGYVMQVANRLARPRVEVVNLGLVDSVDAAFAAGHRFRAEDVDVIFLYVTTYALSSTVLPIVRRAKVPVIILNLQPTAALDYVRFNQLPDRTTMTSEWLSFCNSCPVPEIANVFLRSGIPFHQVTGSLDDEACWREIDEWVEAVRVVDVMAHNRLGVMGHYYNGMLDIYSDLTQLCAQFGGHIEIIEVDELSALRRDVKPNEISARVDLFKSVFDVQSDCAADQLAAAAQTSIALDQLVHAHGLGSLAYYYMGSEGSENRTSIATIILGNSLLTARGVPVAGELEIKNAQAMKILDSFGVGGSFTEYYAMDFRDDVVLMGHDGPGHIGIAEGAIRVRPLQVYHGKVGQGLSVEMSVRRGPVTLLSVVQTRDGNLKLLAAEGESVAGPTLQIGNTNSRYRFHCGAKNFVEQWNAHGPAHHCAVGVGHILSRLQKFAALLRMELAIVA